MMKGLILETDESIEVSEVLVFVVAIIDAIRLPSVHDCCFVFLANDCCHDGAGLTMVSQSDQGCPTWLLRCKLEL